MSALFRAVPDKDLSSATSFLHYVDDCWQHLEADVRQRLQNYVKDLPATDLDSLEFFLSYTPLQTQARHRVVVATKKELGQAIFWDMPSEVADKFISLYLGSESFDGANDWAKQMIVHTGDFKPDHVRRLIAGASKNAQVTGSFQFTALLNTLRGKKRLPGDEFEHLLRENGLEEFALPA